MLSNCAVQHCPVDSAYDLIISDWLRVVFARSQEGQTS